MCNQWNVSGASEFLLSNSMKGVWYILLNVIIEIAYTSVTRKEIIINKTVAFLVSI